MRSRLQCGDGMGLDGYHRMIIIGHMSSKSTFGANNVSNYLSMEYYGHKVTCRNILDGKIVTMCQNISAKGIS